MNHVYSSIINPKFTSFPPPVKPAQVRSTQRQIRHVSFTDGTFDLLQIRALKLASVPQAAHQDMRWWRQQPGGSWCPHWDHICTHVLTGTPIKNKQICCFGFEKCRDEEIERIFELLLRNLSFSVPPAWCYQLLPTCSMWGCWWQLDSPGSSSSPTSPTRSSLAPLQVWVQFHAQAEEIINW